MHESPGQRYRRTGADDHAEQRHRQQEPDGEGDREAYVALDLDPCRTHQGKQSVVEQSFDPCSLNFEAVEQRPLAVDRLHDAIAGVAHRRELGDQRAKPGPLIVGQVGIPESGHKPLERRLRHPRLVAVLGAARRRVGLEETNVLADGRFHAKHGFDLAHPAGLVERPDFLNALLDQRIHRLHLGP